MLYDDLGWLAAGQVFPPQSEWERLKTYRDNRMLYAGELSAVLAPYRRRIQNIVAKFAGYERYAENSLDMFELDLNYFQLTTLKMGDLICGEPPTITSAAGDVEAALERTGFSDKLLSCVYDVSRLGDSVVRLKVGADGKRDFVAVAPDMWFPVVSREDPGNVLCHAIVWPECVEPNGAQGARKQYVVKAQVHGRGFYDAYTFAVDEARTGSDPSALLLANGLNVQLDTYKLGNVIEKREHVPTGLKDFAIVHLHNTVTPGEIYGINDYDRIVPLVAELQVRYSLESLILDKHSAPTMFSPSRALTVTRTGEYVLPTGGVVPVEAGEQPPGYVTWDASLTANHVMIEKLERHLYSLSEMGAVVNDDAFGASQGFEALETRMTNARLKARRLANALTRPVKKLVSMLADVASEEISVCWNDGLPNNEYRETDIAARQVQSGLFDVETVLMDHFDKSEKDAARIAEKVREERGNAMTAFDEESEDEET